MENESKNLGVYTRKEILTGVAETATVLVAEKKLTAEEAHRSVQKAYKDLGIKFSTGEELEG